eukprot:tig00021537_g22288.t1
MIARRQVFFAAPAAPTFQVQSRGAVVSPSPPPPAAARADRVSSPSSLPWVVRLAPSVVSPPRPKAREEPVDPPATKRTVTPQPRRKAAEVKRGRKQSEEHRRKRAEALRGRQLSEETRLKMSLAKRGRANPRFGLKHEETTRAKMRARASERRAVVQAAGAAPARLSFERRLRISQGVRRAWAARRAAAAVVSVGAEAAQAGSDEELELRRMIDAQRMLKELTEEIQRAYRAGELPGIADEAATAAPAGPKPLSPGADRLVTSAYPPVGSPPRATPSPGARTPSPSPTAPSATPTPAPLPSITVAEAARAAAEEEAAGGGRRGGWRRRGGPARPPSPITGLPTDAMAYIYGRWPLKMIDDLLLEAREDGGAPSATASSSSSSAAPRPASPRPRRPARRPCPACSGRGHTRCPHCRAAAFGGICSHCFGSAVELCHACSGTGALAA